MPKQQAGLLGIEERDVITATLERVRAYDPARDGSLVQASTKHEVVEEMRGQLVDTKWTAPPLRVVIVASRPDGGRIWHLLDEERAARLLRVLAHHVEAHTPP